MSNALHREIAQLVLDQRWAALATNDGGAPLASMVAYAPQPGLEGVLMFLSGLSAHTRNLRDDPHASLAITVPDQGEGDPQLLPRVTLRGHVSVIARDDPAFAANWDKYVSRFPAAAPRIELGDFDLFRLKVDEVRYVGGFARAVSATGPDLVEAAREVGA